MRDPHQKPLAAATAWAVIVADPAGLEPATLALGKLCSILLSYGSGAATDAMTGAGRQALLYARVSSTWITRRAQAGIFRVQKQCIVSEKLAKPHPALIASRLRLSLV